MCCTMLRNPSSTAGYRRSRRSPSSTRFGNRSSSRWAWALCSLACWGLSSTTSATVQKIRPAPRLRLRRVLMATAEPLGSVRVEEHKLGRTVVHPGEVLRHSVYTRVVHWGVAVFFVLALLSGFALFTPWLYKFLAPLFGGGPRARLLHPWFGLGFAILVLPMLLRWKRQMTWRDSD